MNHQEAFKALTDTTGLTDTQVAQVAALSADLTITPLTCVFPPVRPLIAGGAAAMAAIDINHKVQPVSAQNLVALIAATGHVTEAQAAQVLRAVLRAIAIEGEAALEAFEKGR